MSAPRAMFRAPEIPVQTPAAPAQQLRRVYLITSPDTRTSPDWPSIRAGLAGRVRGAELAVFDDLFTSSEDYRARWPHIVGELAGAVVIPAGEDGRQLIGRVAHREAVDIAAAGKPVLVSVAAGLIPWERVRARKVRGPGRAVVQLVIRGAAS